jgi:diguanylate cyclase (GGDEF)-like protein
MLRPGGTQHGPRRQLFHSLKSWALWQESPGAYRYVVALCVAWTAALGAGLATTSWQPRHLLTFALIVACGSVVLEATRRQGEPAGILSKDMLSAWYLPVAFTLPPVYSLLMPIPFMVIFQLRIRQIGVYRRVFSVAALGLANGAAAWGFHVVSASWTPDLAPGIAALAWAGTALAFAVLATVANSFLVAVVVCLSSPEQTLRGQLLDADNILIDWGEVCIGVILALVAMLNPLLMLVALTPVILLQRGGVHGQLSAAARLDTKTALLNAPTWEREANSEIARAVRTHSPLCVLLLDLDHFKQVNDFFGHLTGDAVIRAVADVLRAQTRDYDRCARFGGDEFAVLLPQADAEEAHRTADRIRKHIEALAVPADDRFVAVSASAGVAQLTASGQDVTDLLAAADVELYRAKRERPPAPTTAWELEKH